MAAQTRPEPMNASPHHSKVKVSMTLPNPTFVAGTHVSGKMEMECRADKGLGIGVMMVELFALQELTSRDHSATSTFLHSRRLFQGPGLPPSNAVQAHPMPGDPQLPSNYHQARRGISTFLFRIPIPSTSPSSINFGSDLARVKYEVRASVAVAWKGEKRLVTCKREIDVVESFEEDFARVEPEAVVVGEHGKIWMQGKVVGGLIVAGETACVELQVKNHSRKKNSGLTLTLSRTLVLPGLKPGEKSPLQISDVLTTVPFRGADYIIPPGAEGVASLVFDVPMHARGVKGGTFEGDESEGRTSDSLFEIRCILGISLNMGIGTKDIELNIRVPIVHPAALPELAEIAPASAPAPMPYAYNPYPLPSTTPAPYLLQTPYAYPPLPVSPPIPAPYVDRSHNQVWLPPPLSQTPLPYVSPPIEASQPQQYYFPPSPDIPISSYIPSRPLSAGPVLTDAFASNAAEIGMGPPPISGYQYLVPLDNVEPEEGKGELATRVTHHLRLSSRHRSVSPMSHRFPLPVTPIVGSQHSLPPPVPSSSQSRKKNKVSTLRNLPPPPPIIIPAPRNLSTDGTVVHSPRPFLSPKHSYSNSLPKSERVEQLERMAEEVGKAAADLSGDLPKLDPPRNPSPTFLTPPSPKAVPPPPKPKPQDDSESSNIDKTLPLPPLPTVKELANTKVTDARARIDTYFTSQEPDEPKAPPTPLAAVTPVKLPFKPKSVELRAQLLPNPNGASESGLDALEKRLLAEVGTRKLDLSDRRPDARSIVGVGVKPIDIPAKNMPPEPLNDSAISSFTLAGEGIGGAEAQQTRGHGREREYEREIDLELDHDHDSDERTHRAGRSNVSAESREAKRGDRGRKPRKSDGESEGKGVNRKEKVRVKDGERHSSKQKKSAAAKGRVAAWLGEIDPEVPPVDDVVSSSPTVARKPPPFLDRDAHAGVTVAMDEVKHVVAAPVNPEAKEEDVASAPNPRSSGFVPIGTIKHDTLQRRPHIFTKEMTVVEEARRVADIWSSASHTASSPAAVIQPKPSLDVKDNFFLEAKNIVKDVSPVLPLISPQARNAQSSRTDRRFSPPSSAAAVGALSSKLHGYNAPRLPASKPVQTKSPLLPKVIAHPSPQLPTFPPPRPDPEAKYDVRSARGGRGGQVTSVASIWASGALAEPKSRDAQKKLPADLLSVPPKPLRAPFTDPTNRDTPKKAVVTPSPVIQKTQRTPARSLLTASIPVPITTDTTAGEPKLVQLAGKRTKPMTKSSSVPAIVSSSHATPTLSSTASLARPTPTKVVRPPVKVSPTISEVKSDDTGQAQLTSKAPLTPAKSAGSARGDLAFGQARLRDLIKKYQGQTT